MDEHLHGGMHDSIKDKSLPIFSLTSGTWIEVIPCLYYYTNQIAIPGYGRFVNDSQ